MPTFDTDLTRLVTDRNCAGIRITTAYTSATGTTITPPAGTLRTSESGRPVDVKGEFSLPDGQLAVTIDSWGSQASRMETALEPIADEIGYPLVRFLSADGETITTSLQLSHRHADAVWRATHQELSAAGIPVQEIRDATLRDAGPLLRWFPTAVVLGWWHSHVDNKKTQSNTAEIRKQLGEDVGEALAGYAPVGAAARNARLLTSEIIATGIHRRVRMPAKQDSLFGAASKIDGKDGRSSKIEPSKLGIGSLPPVRETQGPVDVTFSTIDGSAFLSLTGLRRFVFSDDPDKQVRHQTLTVALGLLMHALMQQDLLLRAGAELLITKPPRVEACFHGAAPEELVLPTVEELKNSVRQIGAAAGWQGPVDVVIPHDAVLDKLLRLVDKKPQDDA